MQSTPSQNEVRTRTPSTVSITASQFRYDVVVEDGAIATQSLSERVKLPQCFSLLFQCKAKGGGLSLGDQKAALMLLGCRHLFQTPLLHLVTLMLQLREKLRLCLPKLTLNLAEEQLLIAGRFWELRVLAFGRARSEHQDRQQIQRRKLIGFSIGQSKR
jgi:hypothetical protein